jgi:hypothetical protein
LIHVADSKLYQLVLDSNRVFNVNICEHCAQGFERHNDLLHHIREYHENTRNMSTEITVISEHEQKPEQTVHGLNAITLKREHVYHSGVYIWQQNGIMDKLQRAGRQSDEEMYELLCKMPIIVVDNEAALAPLLEDNVPIYERVFYGQLVTHNHELTVIGVAENIEMNKGTTNGFTYKYFERDSTSIHSRFRAVLEGTEYSNM